MSATELASIVSRVSIIQTSRIAQGASYHDPEKPSETQSGLL
jgi:hypothetical protein